MLQLLHQMFEGAMGMVKSTCHSIMDIREDSVKDIGALLDWIATQPHLDENRVIVYGGSYGGYMVLASAVHFR